MKFLEAKLVTLGKWGVGKSCIVKRYVDKTFEPAYKLTIGACFLWTKIEIGDVKLTLHIWDTAGEERFKSITPMYHRAANAILLTFDLTCYDSFTYTKTILLEFNKNSTEKVVIVLVGNKLDLIKKRAVLEEEAKEFALSIGASYHEVSALQDYGIDEIFNVVAAGLVKLATEGNCEKLKFYECTKSVVKSRNQVIKMLSESHCSEKEKIQKCSCKNS